MVPSYHKTPILIEQNMKHRPTTYTLNLLRNEVPGGVELAEEAARAPQTLHVTDTQMKFMKKNGLVDDHGNLLTLTGTSIILEQSTDA